MKSSAHTQEGVLLTFGRLCIGFMYCNIFGLFLYPNGLVA